MDWVLKYWIEWAFGLVAGGLLWGFRSLAKKVKSNSEEQAAIKAGLQALLRAQMVNDYNHYTEKGYAPLYARENFENCWKQYEALGKNGVMSDIRQKFLSLPTGTGRHEHTDKEAQHEY